jgi:hypothetical protein
MEELQKELEALKTENAELKELLRDAQNQIEELTAKKERGSKVLTFDGKKYEVLLPGKFYHPITREITDAESIEISEVEIMVRMGVLKELEELEVTKSEPSKTRKK